MTGTPNVEPAGEAAVPSPFAPPAFRDEAVVFDIVFVLNVAAQGWILEKICRVVEEASGALCHVVFAERNDRADAELPAARHYFFSHFSLAHAFMRRYPVVTAGAVHVWVTHPAFDATLTREDLVAVARRCTAVFVPCSRNRDLLVEWGVAPDAVTVVIGGADPDRFRPKRRTGQGAIGFVGAYYPRKQPETMLALARLMPDRTFILLGPSADSVTHPRLTWENWPKLPEFLALPNVRYVAAPYDDYPAWYGQFDVYCSVSELEGGPIPAIEAMMSNVVPVITDTGFARDILAHGKRGYIIDAAAPAADIAATLRLALADTESDVATAAAGWSWAAFGQAIWRRMRGDVAPATTIAMGAPDSAARYLRRGFHPPSGRGVSMRSRDAEIRIPLPPRFQAGVVEFFAWAPTLPDDGRIGARFAVDGIDCAAASFGARPSIVRVPIPSGAGEDLIRISVHAERLVGAAEIGSPKVGDVRLGLKFGWFRVRPALPDEAEPAAPAVATPAIATPAIATSALARPRLLLFGAYANGNIGDTGQAQSMARHIEACRPDIDVYATSPASQAAPYEFRDGRRHDAGRHAADTAGINAFQALLIGGGGLFAALHKPFDNPAWAEQLTLPVMVFANGASPEVVRRCDSVIRRARHVSGRDRYSVDAFQAIRPDAILVHDPILSDPALNALAVRSVGSEPGRGICVVPRKLTDRRAANYRHLASLMTEKDTALSMFPSVDRRSGALAIFAASPIACPQDMTAMLGALSGSAVVVSERYHGCILALKQGLPCLGLHADEGEESKIVSLYRQLGLEHLLVDLRARPLSRSDIMALAADYDPAPVLKRIEEIGARFRASLAEALSAIA